MTSYGETRLMAAPRANLVDDLVTVSGLTLCFGLLAFVPGTVNLIGASKDGDVDWNGDTDVFPPILNLLGALTVTIFGMISVFLGFQYLACRWGSKTGSLVGLAITLAAWFPFAVNIAQIAFHAKHEIIGAGPLVVPPPMGKPEATSSEIVPIAIMGIIGFYGYAGVVIGALTFLHWKMYRFFAGYADTYTAAYYRSRLQYYGGLTIFVGCVQTALGIFVKDKFGDGQLAMPVVSGPFFILWPELSITVGICQLLFGLMIIYRAHTPGVGPSTGNVDNGLFFFQVVAWFVFVVSVGCQVIGQVALHTANQPGLFLVNVIGFAIFPIYLDAMAHTTPENVTSDMFSLTKSLGQGA